MGDSGAAGRDGTESESDGDTGPFEFGNVADDTEETATDGEDELSDAVDFSLGMEDVDFGGDERADTADTNPTDTDAADASDSPAGRTETPGAPETAPASVENAAPTTGSPTPPDEGDSASNGEAAENGSGDDAFYNIDPVDESEKAFSFAEKQSKAAYEFAYKEATQNPLTKLLRRYTSREVRERLDQVFSRKMLGSVFIGMSATNIVMVSVDAYLRKNPTVPWWEPLLWVAIFSASVAVFVWWERLARKATEAANQAAESATEAASEAAESASKKAEAASEAASQAAESATGGDETGDTTATPTKLNGKGQTAGSYPGGGADTRAPPARRRAPDRRPNKRFEPETTTQQRLSRYEDEAFEQVDVSELPQQGGGFENAGGTDAETVGHQPLAEDDD